MFLLLPYNYDSRYYLLFFPRFLYGWRNKFCLRFNIEHAKLELTESTALLYYLASKYELDLDANIDSLYTKKLEMLKKSEKSK